MSKSKNSLMLLIKTLLICLALFIAIKLLNKIDFPSPNQEIEKTIPNEKLKIVK
tara:strand:+ start:409 stop:570 length:162 start_codon:yes stop_codon:yes gene_type:complete